MTHHLSRRRLITITAATAGLALLPFSPVVSAACAAELPVMRWRGVALGADASLTLHGQDATRTRQAVTAVMDEISRLEKVFSLFREDSALSALNRDGVLHMPPLDLVMCLREAERFSRATNGGFDATVQPLWALYARHFATPGADPTGPQKSEIAAARSLVDYTHVSIAADKIVLGKPGMALTLNGIAQGYITDRVTDLLRSHGFDHVLVNMGETRALGAKSDGTSWQVAINRTDQVVPLANQAIATSGGYGTRLDTSGQHHHLFDPVTGRSANRWSSISVMAPTATIADALSTAFSAMAIEDIQRIGAEFRGSVYAYDTDNRQVLTAG